jgi:hypothetical protein
MPVIIDAFTILNDGCQDGRFLLVRVIWDSFKLHFSSLNPISLHDRAVHVCWNGIKSRTNGCAVFK